MVRNAARNRHNEEVAMLLAESGPLSGQRFALRDVFIIGRDGSCDLVISDRQVSRQHACFTIETEGVFLEDLNSKNGTHINGHLLLDKTMLADGDSIQIALIQTFTFISSDATVPLDMEETAMRKLPPLPVGSVTMGKLRLDAKAHRVWIYTQGKDIEIIPPLSASQFKLLELLYQNQEQVVARGDLAVVVWGEKEAYNVSEQALDALVRRLRDRIAEIDNENSYIVTVRGHGLRLENPAR